MFDQASIDSGKIRCIIFVDISYNAITREDDHGSSVGVP